MFHRRLPAHLIAIGAIALLAGAAQWRGVVWWQNFEVSWQDALMQFGRPAAAAPNLVFLARDTASANLETADLEKLFDLSAADEESRRALQLMVHEWPWPREIYALILDRLTAAGARAVAFDLTFPKPSANDDAFRESLARHRDRVVVAGNITHDLEGGASVFGVPTASLIPPASPRDPRIGYDNFWPDADGVVRHARYRFAVQHGVWTGGEDISLAGRTLEKAGLISAVPADREGHRMRLAGPPGTFRPHSIHEIFVPEYWKRNYAGGAFFRDKIVVIGAAGNWQHDEHLSALGVMPGAEIQINAINAALAGEFLRPVSWPVALGLWLLAGLLALGCCLVGKSPVLRVSLLLATSALWAGAQWVLYNRAGVFLPLAGPLFIVGVTGLFSIIYDLVSAGAEHLRLRRAIAERKRAEEVLQTTNRELERRVAERTTELSASNASLTALLGEKDVLLKEIHHRVKNNLQTISSLLNLQAGNIKDAEARQLFTDTRFRVRSMALIHEKLYQSHDLARIDFADYLQALTSGLAGSFSGVAASVRISVEVEDIMLAVDSAVPCGLIVNELVTNCFKYAFAGGRSGEISVRMARAECARFQLSVADDGVGFPKGVNFRETESLGMQLVTTLTEQLEGEVHMTNGTGTKFEITFPETANV
jgi:two-component sensor histidine kinase/CHASE2 domain-containing sensor protein